MRFLLLVGALVLVGGPSLKAIEPEPWVHHARDLFTGDENKFAASKKWFSEHPELLSSLAQELSSLPEGHLALDTLVALGHRDVVPYLLKNLSQNQDGSYALALSAFLNADSARLILTEFKRLVESAPSKSLEAPLLLPLLDTLARLKVPLSERTLKHLTAHPWPEVRSSLVNYLRESLHPASSAPPLWLFEPLAQDPAYQVRLGALYLYKESPGRLNSAVVTRVCGAEKHDLVKKFCDRYILGIGEKAP